MPPRVALATSANLPDLIADEGPLREALRAAGIDAVPAVWSDPTVDWSAFDACIVRTPWDYTTQREAFLAWAERTESRMPLFNSAATLRWNTDKRYLHGLAREGVRIVPFQIFERGGAMDLGAALSTTGWDRAVIKPVVGATARRQIRVHALDKPDLAAAQAHLNDALIDEDMIVQPYVQSVTEEGEASLVYFGGAFSHALRKRPKRGDYRVQMDWGGTYERLHASAAQKAEADRVLDAIGPAMLAAGEAPEAAPLLYARVDLLDWEGAPAVIELEVVEPQLFFTQAENPGLAGRMMAEAFMQRAPRA
ncbi:MAG: hypothetical protein IBJ10_10290 [Phycisphaerales bacterium]|nr:hypothetical protein [Phycisphaerales bacterium]